MAREIWEKFVKLLFIFPGAFNSARHSVRKHALSAYAGRCFPGVQFGPLAYATSDCEFEAPCRIWYGSELSGVKMGRHSYCGSRSILVHSSIGRFCSIGNDTIIGTWFHPTQLVSTFPGFYSKNKHTINFRSDDEIKEVQRVTVGNDIWIGHRAVVLGGITIGDGAIIGAGAVVTKNVEPYSVVAGVPARALRKRFPQYTIDRLLDLRWWNYDDEILRRYSHLFGNPDAFIEGFAR